MIERLPLKIQHYDDAGRLFLPTSFAQRRLWFLYQLEPDSPAYNISQVVNFRGPLNFDLLASAIQKIVARHEILRTTFAVKDGEPIQIIDPGARVHVQQTDNTGVADAEKVNVLEKLIADQAGAPFRLEEHPPLRVHFVRLDTDRSVLIATMHHIVADGWSLGVFVRELSQIYNSRKTDESFQPPELAIQYSDFTLWQHRWRQSPAFDKQLEFWRSRLSTAPRDLMLSQGQCPAQTRSSSGTVVKFDLSKESTLALQRLSAECGATLFMTLLSIFQALIYRYSDQEDFLIGTVVANRNRVELESLIGFFVNTLVVRSDTLGNPTFLELLRRVRRSSLDAQSNQDLPFELMVQSLGGNRRSGSNPLFQILFVLENAPLPDFSLADVEVNVRQIHNHTSKFDLTLFATEQDETLRFALEYSVELFDEPFVEGLGRHFLTLLEGIVAAPSRRLLDYSLMPAEEEAQLLCIANDTKKKYGEALVHQLIARKAIESPFEVALVFGEEQITYATLESRVNQLAQHLRASGVTIGTVVALYLDRSADLIIAILATLKAGGAYLPIDMSYPRSYLSPVLEDASPRLVITTRAHALDLQEPALQFVFLDDDREEIGSRPILAPEVQLSPDDLAYVLYTSGSTGRPKGVLVEHRSILNISCWIGEVLAMDASDRGLLKTPIGFDAAAREIFPILLSGGALVISPPDAHRDVQSLSELVRREDITVFHCVPSLLQHLLEEPAFTSAKKLRAVMSGGESLPIAVAARFLKQSQAALFNVYGPTETTVDSLFHRVEESTLSGPIPIGRPIANTSVYVLDFYLRPVPRGVVGELYVGGVGVARGYLNQPKLTAERFLPDPFTGEPGARMYRTGDLGRLLPHGAIEYVGRTDNQVKLSGCRVELGEIENTLSLHPGVNEAAGALKFAPDGQSRLCAYVVPNASWTTADRDQKSLAAGVIKDWEEVFARVYFEEVPADAEINTVGWNSSYTRAPLPVAEMEESIEHTIARLLRLEPKRVLEIGCGTGLLLLPLAAHCDHYAGTDFCPEVIDYLRQITKSKAAHVELHVKQADELQCFEKNSFDLIILNSVIQYFPSDNYLRRVLRDASALLVDGGTIFIGDVRDKRLHQMFCESVQLFRAAEATRARALRRLAADQMWRDEELLLDPAVILEIAQELHCDVEFQLKGGRAHNELNKFRYDVLLHFGVSDRERSVAKTVRYNSALSDTEKIIQRLREAPDAPVIVTGVPNARLSYDKAISALLAEPSYSEMPAASIRKRAHSLNNSGIDPEELRQNAQAVGLATNLTLALSIDPCCFDIIYNPAHALISNLSADWIEKASVAGDLVNDPLRLRHTQLLGPVLRQFLAERVPAHMVPHKFLFLPELPLLPNGKLDRLALPDPELRRPQLTEQFEEPQTALQSHLCDIWKNVLQIDRVGLNDNFFELGGHSLLATQVMARVRDQISSSFRLRDLFAFPTIAGLSLRLEQAAELGVVPKPLLIPSVEQNGPLPLSYAQQRLWFIEQMDPGNTVYLISHALRVSGSLDLAAFQRAVDLVVERQQSLRTYFPCIDGVPGQVVAASSNNHVSFVDLLDQPENSREEMALKKAHEASRCCFDLTVGPLFRVTVLRITDLQHLILLQMHHIISDGWSMGVLLRELSELYRAEVSGRPASLDDLPINYVDFSLWQRQYLTGERLERLRNYWQSQLGHTPPVLQLPADYPRPKTQSFRGEVITFTIEKNIANRLTEFGKQRGATLFMTMLTVFQVLLGRLSRQDNYVIGTVIANRNVAQLEPLIGFFVNMLALRADLSGSPCFDELLQRVRETTLDAYEHQDMPFEQLIDFLQVDRNTNYQAVFQVLFVIQNTSLPEPSLEGLTSERVRLKKSGAMFDMSLEFRETAGELVGSLEYNGELFERRTAERFVERYRVLIEAMLADPKRPVREVNLIPAAELAEIINDATGPAPVYVIDSRLETLIERQAATRPQKTAIKFSEQDLSYFDLDKAATRIGVLLYNAGATSEKIIGVLVERSLAAVVGLLGVLKSGAAFVYLDPSLPEERLGFLLADTSCDIVITSNTAAHLLRNWHGRMIRVDETVNGPVPELPVSRDFDDLAYVTYTSGSTGKPKAVLISQGALVDRILANQQVLPPLTHDDIFLHCYSFNYDGGIISLLWPLAMGATLVFQPLEEIGDGESVSALVRKERITVVDSIPAVLRLLFRSLDIKDGLSLRHVITGGEECPVDVPDLVLDNVDVCFSNQYGPSEATVNATSWSCDRTTWNRAVSIGRPLPNTLVLILDDHGQPCPIGVPGELYIGGPSLARGYLGRSELTAERFVIASCGSIPAQRFYRTGDQARFRNDGTLDFCGRTDRQVQIRGMRVELSEIESTIREHSAVQDVVVDLVDGPDAAPRLLAHVLPLVASHPDKASERRLEEWTEVFEDLFASPHEVKDARRDFVGWDSSYTSEPLPFEAMSEWLDETVARIKELRPKRVLEIGCGMGLLLFSIAPSCERYDACDISSAALAHINGVVQRQSVGDVRLCRAFAHEIDRLFDGLYDTIILNSVIQYFPTAEYLAEVLQKVLKRLKPHGRVFIGDVRNLLVQEAFYSAIELARAAPELTVDELRQRVALRMKQDNELAVAPAYFRAFAAQHSNDVAGLGISLKRGKHRNELTDLRYDVVIERGSQKQASNGIEISEWNQNGWQQNGLEHVLREERPPALLVRDVPNGRLQILCETLNLITHRDREKRTAEWLRSALNQFSAPESWEPEDIWECARRSGYRANLRPSYSSAGQFDAFFWRADVTEKTIAGAELTTSDPFVSLDQLASNPVGHTCSRDLVPELRDFLKRKLPRHMVPVQIFVVDELPRAGDKLQLQKSLVKEVADSGDLVAPRNLLETELAEIWGELLKSDLPSIHSDFFSLGGHSLLAAQLVSRIRHTLGLEVSVRQLFENPTVATLSAAIRDGLQKVEKSLRLSVDSVGEKLSFNQLALWKRQRAAPGNVNHIGLAFRLVGFVDYGVLQRSFVAVCTRHGILRMKISGTPDDYQTSFAAPESCGLPLLRFDDRRRLDKQAQLNIVTNFVRRPLDLQEGTISFELLRFGAGEHVLVMRLHQIAFDGWATRVFLSELVQAFTAEASGNALSLPPVMQYIDVARQEHARAQTGLFDSQIDYLRKVTLSRPESIAKINSNKGEGRVEFFISSDEYARIRDAARKRKATPFSFFLAAYVVALSTLVRQQRLIVTITSAGRSGSDYDSVIGPFANDLPIRIDLPPTYEQLLKHVREGIVEAVAHENIPWGYLATKLVADGFSLPLSSLRAALVLHQEQLQIPALPGIHVEPLTIDCTVASSYDLRLSISHMEDVLRCRIRFNEQVVEEDQANRVVAQFLRALTTMMNDPLPVLTRSKYDPSFEGKATAVSVIGSGISDV